MIDGEPDDLLDVRQAAALTARHPETVRRWVWSGRLPAQREGNRLMVARRDVLALAGVSSTALSLRAWAKRAEAALDESARAGRPGSAADLVLEDRARRQADGLDAGR